MREAKPATHTSVFCSESGIHFYDPVLRQKKDHYDFDRTVNREVSIVRKMKCLLLIVLIAVLLTGCGEDANDRESQSSDKKPSVTGALDEGAGSQAVQPKATSTPTPTPTPIPHPKTAATPAALDRNDVSHASGATEEWTDPETGEKCTVVEDIGEDGYTKTMNCYDGAGKLVWWENYEYDVNDMECMICRMSADDNRVILKKMFIRDDNGKVIRVNHIEPLPQEVGDGEYTFCVEEFYPDGVLKTKTTYYPTRTNSKALEEYVFEYNSDGTEAYRSHSDKDGNLLEEYVDGIKIYIAPNTPFEMLQALNDASDEDFEGLWEACRKKVQEKKLEETWDELCEACSCIADGYFKSDLFKLRHDYGLILFDSTARYDEWSNINFDLLALYLDEQPLSETLKERIYKQGSHIVMGGTIWLPDEYKTAKGKMKQKDRNADDLIRILVVDYSKTIWNETINHSMLLDDPDNAERMVERAETMIEGLFEDCTDRICLTSYPDLADVVLEIRTEYPYAGKYYYSDGTPAKVWNTSITLKAINQRGKGEASATFKHSAGDTVSVTGGTEIYMTEPDLTEDEHVSKAEKFTNTVLSWFE